MDTGTNKIVILISNFMGCRGSLWAMLEVELREMSIYCDKTLPMLVGNSKVSFHGKMHKGKKLLVRAQDW